MSKWQPIETAPQDGTNVLVWDGFGVVCAAYSKFPGFHEWVETTGTQGEENDRLDYADQASESPDGWSAFDPLNGDELGIEPTHWMPLPEPPK